MINRINGLHKTETANSKQNATKADSTTVNIQEQKAFADIPSETYRAYHAISFKGSQKFYPDIKNAYNDACKGLANSSPEDNISTADAIELLKPLELSDKKLLDTLLSCSYDSHNEKVEINKQAVYYTILLYGGLRDVPSAKIPNIIASSLDNENKCFSEKAFDSLFSPSGELRLSKRKSLKRIREDNYPNARKIALIHKSELTKQISEILKNETQRPKVDFDTEEIFSVDLEQEKAELINRISKLKENGQIGADIYTVLRKNINDNNFNLKDVYKKHYSLLNECTTLQEAKELYPEIKIPDLNFEDNGYNRVLRSRLAKEDMDKIGLYILKKIYIEQKQPDMIIVDMENSYPTTYQSMINAGIDFGKVPAEINAMFDKTAKLVEKFSSVDSLDNTNIEFLIRRNASKQSRIWAEYIGITNKYWHPVRAIAHKQKHPLTSYYQTDKLVDGYLFYLYKYKDKSIPSKNPFEQYADGKPFNKEKKAALEKIYFLYRNNYNPEILSTGFLEFKSNFDKKAMEKSLTKLENHYKNTFANWFMTKERREKYENALNNSYRLLFEKLDICKLSQKMDQVDVTNVVEDKLTNEELVDYIAETEEDETENIQAEFKRLRNIVKMSNNKELLNLFNQYVGSNSENIDCDNFLEYKPIIENCIQDNEINNPEKLIAMFKLHNSYMNYLFSSDEGGLTFEEYVQKNEQKYKQPDGSINYSEMNKDMEKEEEYNKLSSLQNSEEKNALLTILNKKLLDNNKSDFKTVLDVINMYDSLPDIFKTKFYMLAAGSDRLPDEKFVMQLKEMYEKISSWNMDKPEIITMDAGKIPQKIVITSKAKYDLLDDCNGNLERFDTIINKFYSAATKRIGERQGQGVKVLTSNCKYAAELKIQGSQAVGSKRLYAREPLAEDIKKYGHVKYVFDTLAEHL